MKKKELIPVCLVWVQRRMSLTATSLNWKGMSNTNSQRKRMFRTKNFWRLVLFLLNIKLGVWNISLVPWERLERESVRVEVLRRRKALDSTLLRIVFYKTILNYVTRFCIPHNDERPSTKPPTVMSKLKSSIIIIIFFQNYIYNKSKVRCIKSILIYYFWYGIG